jgi:hypothetical protein
MKTGLLAAWTALTTSTKLTTTTRKAPNNIIRERFLFDRFFICGASTKEFAGSMRLSMERSDL